MIKGREYVIGGYSEIKPLDGATYGFIKILYDSLGIKPQEVLFHYPANIIEGIYKGKYFAHEEDTTERVYVTALHPTLTTSFYTENNAIHIYNLSVAKELRGANIGSRVLSMYKLAGISLDLDVRLRAVPIELNEKLGIEAGVFVGSKKFKKHEKEITRHTSGLIKFYEKNGFVLTDKGFGAEMELKVSDENRKEFEAWKKFVKSGAYNNFLEFTYN